VRSGKICLRKQLVATRIHHEWQQHVLHAQLKTFFADGIRMFVGGSKHTETLDYIKEDNAFVVLSLLWYKQGN
jgi:hypothetical protein